MIIFLFILYILFVSFFLWLRQQTRVCGGYDFKPADETKAQIMLALYVFFVYIPSLMFNDLKKKIKEKFSW